MKVKVISTIQILIIFIIAISIYKTIDYNKSLKATENIQASSESVLFEIEDSNEFMSLEDISNNFLEGLKIDYPDTVGYIKVDNTSIAYPIVQSVNNDYYLTHSPDKEWNPNGSIFMSYLNNPDYNDDNTVIYGHNIRSGKLFQNLHKFKSQDFYNETNTVEIYTPEGLKTYKVFSVFDTHPEYQYKYANFDSQEGKDVFVKEMLNKSLIDTDVDEEALFDKNAKLLTLSTCEVGGQDRLVVQAYLVD